ncbi:hypothetical protein ACFV5G_39930, partial [Streptomyces sp. NPDC059766]|uniref:hypothetical protein n=1 Tax=Streptomyces sp. NPDC059766 TaxID=3346940 RepID=UPI003656BB54
PALGVAAAATLGATLGVAAAATLRATLGVAAAATLRAALGVAAAATLGPALGVTETATLRAALGVTETAALGAALGVASATALGPALGVAEDLLADPLCALLIELADRLLNLCLSAAWCRRRCGRGRTDRGESSGDHHRRDCCGCLLLPTEPHDVLLFSLREAMLASAFSAV